MKRLALALVLAGCSADTFVGADGAVAGDAGGGGDAREDAGCTTGAACPPNALCSAFDDAQETLGPFVNISQNGGNVTFETDQVFTCPRALAAFSPMSPSTTTLPRGAIGATKSITAVVTAHARAELDVIFPKVLTGAASFLFMYANSDVNNGLGVVYTGSWLVHDGVTNDDVNIDPKTGEWNHVAFDVTFAQADNVGVISFTYTDSGGNVQTAKLSKSTLGGGVPTVSSLNFGVGVLPFGTTSGPMTMYIDDIVFSPF